MDKLLNDIKEDAAIPANVMGASSSTPETGGIDTYDPLLKKKKNLRSIVLTRKTLQDLKNGNR